MSNIAQAKIFFGSTEENKEVQQERKSPFDGAVVSTAPVCDVKDTLKALNIAKMARRAKNIHFVTYRIDY